MVRIREGFMVPIRSGALWSALCLSAFVVGCSTEDVDEDEDGFVGVEDCDDLDPLRNPDIVEVCDGVDNNCDGRVDEGLLITSFVDQDGDGFGVEGQVVEGCEVEDGYALRAGDCDDADSDRHPHATERCDDVDDDCDGRLVAPDGAFWHTASGTEKLEGIEGAEFLRSSLVLDEPGTLEMCSGVYYLDIVVDSDNVIITSRFGEYGPLFVGGRLAPNIEIRAVGARTHLQHLRFTGGRGGLFNRDGKRVGSAVACAAAGSEVVIDDAMVVGGDDVSIGRVAALGGCSMSLTRFDARANPDSALYFEGGVHEIVDSEFGTPLEVPGRGGTFVDGADVSMRGVSFDNLRSDNGAAFWAVDSHVRMAPSGDTPSRIINTRSAKAAVILQRSTFEAEGVDMGVTRVGSTNTDNEPHDIWVSDIDATYKMRDNASFVCDPTGCVDR